MIKIGLLNIRFIFMKIFFVNNMIIDYNIDVFCLIEIWLKFDDYIILNEFIF